MQKKRNDSLMYAADLQGRDNREGRKPMPFVSTKEMLRKAQEGSYAVGAFNAENMEMVQAIIAAAEAENAPVMIQTTPGTLKYAGPACFAGLVSRLARDSKVPVALHLDHGNSYELAAECAREGYTSLMIDGSKLPYEENIALTRRVVEMAGTNSEMALIKLSDIFQHSSVKTTRIYLGLRREELLETYDLLAM